MSDYDLVIRNGTVATAADTTECDVGIRAGVVATLGRGLGPGAREIDAAGKLVLPGGIDSHCHIEQRSSPASSAPTISTAPPYPRRLAGPRR
jgi:dihydropyrimidinase